MEWSDFAGPIATIFIVFGAGVIFGIIATTIVAKIFTKDFIDSLVAQRYMKMHKDAAKGKPMKEPKVKKTEKPNPKIGKTIGEVSKKKSAVKIDNIDSVKEYTCICGQTESVTEDVNLVCPICNTKAIYPIGGQNF